MDSLMRYIVQIIYSIRTVPGQTFSYMYDDTYIIYLFAKHCLAICKGSEVASKAFSTLVLNAIRLSISTDIPFNLSSNSFFQYLTSSSLWSEKI